MDVSSEGPSLGVSSGGWGKPRVFLYELIESLSKRRFCQHGRQPVVNRVVIDGE